MACFKIFVLVMSGLCKTLSRIKSHKLEAHVDQWFSHFVGWRVRPLCHVPDEWLGVDHGS